MTEKRRPFIYPIGTGVTRHEHEVLMRDYKSRQAQSEPNQEEAVSPPRLPDLGADIAAVTDRPLFQIQEGSEETPQPPTEQPTNS